MFKNLIYHIRDIYGQDPVIPLHSPKFENIEKKFVNSCIDSTYVSSLGSSVNLFEKKISEFTGSKFAIATVNGTSGLHVALKLNGVEKNTEVITQSLTFIATCNAISYCQAHPIFLDVEIANLGLSPISLEDFLTNNCEIRNDGYTWNKRTNRKISACMPVHTFGFPSQIDQIKNLCKKFRIPVVEDAAASLGSFYKNIHVGVRSDCAVFSFNGNKIITTGGGGMIITNKKVLANYLKHITTTAKKIHKWEYLHNKIGYNYRMPNLNATLGLAQVSKLNKFLKIKRKIAASYQDWGIRNGLQFIKDPNFCKSNYWLNAILLKNKSEKNQLLKECHASGIMSRPLWKPMHKLKIYSNYFRAPLPNTDFLYDRVVNLPSSVI